MVKFGVLHFFVSTRDSATRFYQAEDVEEDEDEEEEVEEGT